MNTIQVRVLKDKPAVTAFKKNPEVGYVILEQSATDYSLGWLNEITKTHIMKGKVKLLQKLVENPLPGNLIICEYLESEDKPQRIQDYLDNEKNYEAAIKRLCKDGPEFTFQGELILRITDYDPTGLLSDKTVKHDNQDEIDEWKRNNGK